MRHQQDGLSLAAQFGQQGSQNAPKMPVLPEVGSSSARSPAVGPMAAANRHPFFFRRRLTGTGALEQRLKAEQTDKLPEPASS